MLSHLSYLVLLYLLLFVGWTLLAYSRRPFNTRHEHLRRGKHFLPSWELGRNAHMENNVEPRSRQASPSHRRKSEGANPTHARSTKASASHGAANYTTQTHRCSPYFLNIFEIFLKYFTLAMFWCSTFAIFLPYVCHILRLRCFYAILFAIFCNKIFIFCIYFSVFFQSSWFVNLF